MLELRPSCENCNKALPPNAEDARICSFECTFCARCVDEILKNVCPNCAGGFCPRPVRPARAWRGEAHLGRRPATTAVVHRPVDLALHAQLVANIGKYDPYER